MVLNNRLLRILQLRNKYTSTLELYAYYYTLPVDKLFKFQILLHAHKLIFNISCLPSIFQADRLVNYNVHTYSTRSSHDFHRAQVTSSFGSKMSSNLCARYWNSLHANLKITTNFNSFKKTFKATFKCGEWINSKCS